jgi:hypothetical protein
MPKDRLTVSSETRPNCNHILETAISPGGTAFDVLQLDATADASVQPLTCMPSSSQSDDKRSITLPLMRSWCEITIVLRPRRSGGP